jgi:YggT family protein
MLSDLVYLYSLVVLAAVILSWIPSARENPAAQLVVRLTEPVFEKIRRVIPPAGGFDLSPMVLLVGLQLLRRLLH